MKYYKIISHYVVMETHEVPVSEVSKFLKENRDLKDYDIKEKLEAIIEDEYLIKSDTRDFEVVDYEIIEEEEQENYTVWVGGTEVTTGYVTKQQAEDIAARYRREKYTDVQIEKITGATNGYTTR